MGKMEVLEYNAQFSEYFFSLEKGDELIIVVVENTNEIQGTNFYIYSSDQNDEENIL
jgi:hypothetical protein